MNKTEFIRAVAKRTGSTQRAAEDFIFAYQEVIREELSAGGSVDFTGFGRYYVKTRSERQGKNPSTGEVMVIPEAKVPSFKPGKILRDAVG
ncbi:MAG: HU family DNA-binding protein [Oscillospiraceae bacterium]|nr:HU family DNA-binding protein [Oscillospiraceae bacterium]